jgi:hypothetical protein
MGNHFAGSRKIIRQILKISGIMMQNTLHLPPEFDFGML